MAENGVGYCKGPNKLSECGDDAEQLLEGSRPGQHRGDRRVRQRELQRGRQQAHTVRAAHGD